jgi:dTMP kinase
MTKFIVFEGGEGAGKTSAIQIIAQKLRDVNVDVLVTREPGGTALGESLRELLMSGQAQDSLTQMLMMLAARSNHIKNVIAPAIERGTYVLCDRYDLSTWAYQGCYLNFQDFAHWFDMLHDLGHYDAHQYIYLDVEPKIGLSRRLSDNEKLTFFDKKKLDFHEKVRFEMNRAFEARKLNMSANHHIKFDTSDLSQSAVAQRVLANIHYGKYIT